MRKFIKKLLCFSLNIPLIIVCLMIIQKNIENSDLDNYDFAMVDKFQRLQDTFNEDKRIIFVGGSNLAFSLDSEMIEKEFNIPVINTGLHAGVGIFHEIDDILPYVHKNDIIVLCPEYWQISKSGNGTNSAWELEIIINRKKITDLQKKGFYDYPTDFAFFMKSLLKSGLTSSHFDDDCYRRSAFNKYGDVTVHIKNDKILNDEMFILYMNNPFELKYYKYFENAVNELKEKNTVVIYNYPICHEATFNTNIENIVETDNYLRQHLNVIFAGTKEEYVCKRDMLFDTPYHANKRGREWRTKLVIKHLHECYFDKQEN